MNKFNEHILLVMRWLHNNDSVSIEKLEANYRAADAADAAYYAADAATYAAYTSVYRVSHAASVAASVAAAARVDTTKYYMNNTKKHLNKYFELTKEGREAYEERAIYLNVLGANNAYI